MTNPRIQEIEQKFLELAQRDAQLYPLTMAQGAINHYNSPSLGNWARLVIRIWQGEEVIGFPNNKFELAKRIRDKGNFSYETTSPETQVKINELVEEWEGLLERRQRNNMEIIISDQLKKIFEEMVKGVIVGASFFPERAKRFLELEGTRNYFSLDYETNCWQSLYLGYFHNPPENFVELVKECRNLNQTEVRMLSELQTQLWEKTQEFDQLQSKIQQLQCQLANSQSSQNQSEVQLRAKEAEFQRVVQENQVNITNLKREVENLQRQIRVNQQVYANQVQVKDRIIDDLKKQNGRYKVVPAWANQEEQRKLRWVSESLANQITINQQKDQKIDQLQTSLEEEKKKNELIVQQLKKYLSNEELTSRALQEVRQGITYWKNNKS
ncbi:hypothetical protein [endosymbiont GvMRE of Glomus versiforme]|uniref:hypothetical protein n=1 Tax=endosymbiont GvMRE of Glomus versiforme TaxID=2039283 RepID=UPI000EE6D614|nr:hypothetical protein [endosymbiont GvMRE of Glomus versiforme]RHZ35736.1 hypothetical protein GvMRE_Ic6g26 [endosymbiont GvMRE of Glomus versiforme]